MKCSGQFGGEEVFDYSFSTNRLESRNRGSLRCASLAHSIVSKMSSGSSRTGRRDTRNGLETPGQLNLEALKDIFATHFLGASSPPLVHFDIG